MYRANVWRMISLDCPVSIVFICYETKTNLINSIMLMRLIYIVNQLQNDTVMSHGTLNTKKFYSLHFTISVL